MCHLVVNLCIKQDHFSSPYSWPDQFFLHARYKWNDIGGNRNNVQDQKEKSHKCRKIRFSLLIIICHITESGLSGYWEGQSWFLFLILLHKVGESFSSKNSTHSSKLFVSLGNFVQSYRIIFIFLLLLSGPRIWCQLKLHFV